MKLTKKYQIVYKENEMAEPLNEKPEGTITYVGKGFKGSEFDTHYEAQEFIDEKGLAYNGQEQENE